MTVKWNTNAIMQRMKLKVSNGVEAVAEAVRKDAVRRIEEPPKTGRVYSGPPFRVGKPPHQASAPGESPADDTGELKRSGLVAMRGELEAQVSFGGRGGEYARDLEYGDMNRQFPVAARPFLRPSVVAVKKQVQTIMEAELRK